LFLFRLEVSRYRNALHPFVELAVGDHFQERFEPGQRFDRPDFSRVNDFHDSTISQLQTFNHQFPQAENVTISGGLILTTDEHGIKPRGGHAAIRG
jgi:hypothetical protein